MWAISWSMNARSQRGHWYCRAITEKPGGNILVLNSGVQSWILPRPGGRPLTSLGSFIKIPLYPSVWFPVVSDSVSVLYRLDYRYLTVVLLASGCIESFPSLFLPNYLRIVLSNQRWMQLFYHLKKRGRACVCVRFVSWCYVFFFVCLNTN